MGGCRGRTGSPADAFVRPPSPYSTHRSCTPPIVDGRPPRLAAFRCTSIPRGISLRPSSSQSRQEWLTFPGARSPPASILTASGMTDVDGSSREFPNLQTQSTLARTFLFPSRRKRGSMTLSWNMANHKNKRLPKQNIRPDGVGTR